jgi:hypothetical protein
VNNAAENIKKITGFVAFVLSSKIKSLTSFPGLIKQLLYGEQKSAFKM